jgi:hypothetical protein
MEQWAHHGVVNAHHGVEAFYPEDMGAHMELL